MRLKTGFSQFSPRALADKGDAIVAALTGNPFFPGPLVPTVAVVKAAVQTLRDALAMTGPGRPAAVAAAAAALTALLTQLGTNLANDPANSEEALDTTAFDRPRPAVRRSGPPETPQNVRLEDGAVSRTVRVRCDAPEGAREIEAEWTMDPMNGPWMDAGLFPNSQEILLADLTRAKDLWVRLRSHGTNGESNWSDTAGPWLVR